MRSFILLISSVFAVVVAQTPEGFAPEAPASLQVTFENNKAVTPAGLLLDRSVVAKQPSIRLQDGTEPSGQFMQLIVDVDVPAKDGTRTTFLHLAQSNLNAGSAANSTQAGTNGTAQAASNSTAAAAVAGPYANATSAASNSTGAVALASNSSTVEASYLQPSPPAGDVPHKYVVLLFAQPAGFSVPAQFANVLSTADTSPQVRAGFDVAAFAKAAGLGVPLGGTFFTVQNSNSSATAEAGASNSTGAATSSNGTAAAAESSNSTTAAASSGTAAASFTGAASKQAYPASILGLAILVGAMSIAIV